MIRVALIAVALAASATAADAHPFAVSQIEATADGDSVRARFNLDAISVTDLHARLAAPGSREQALLAYLDDRFAVANAGSRCGRDADTSISELAGRVHVDAAYRCRRPLSVVELESTLFLDEATPHRVIATIRYGRRLDRYLFGRSERRAAVDVTRGGAAAVGGRQFRTATPPAGAFAAPPPPPAAAPPPIGSGFVAFVGLGIDHIFTGLDHVLFVIVLVIGARSLRALAVIVTAFTAAHSLTLLLGGLGLVTVSPRLVEPLIAASIVYVAVDNVIGSRHRHRTGVVFGFGLMHGLGFAGALGALDLSAQETAPMLLGLNLGVELGQLAIVVPLYGLVVLARRRERVYTAVRLVASAAASLVGAIWVITRAV